MAISYNKLWKLLIDRKMSKADLRRAAGIAPNTMTKLNRDEEVALETLGKICGVLGVNKGMLLGFSLLRTKNECIRLQRYLNV